MPPAKSQHKEARSAQTVLSILRFTSRPDADKNKPQPMERITEVSPAPEVKAAGIRIRPGRRSLCKQEAGPPSTVEALSHVIDYLGSLQSNVESDEHRRRVSLIHGLTVLQSRRLRRTGRGGGGAEGMLGPYQGGGGTLALLAPSKSVDDAFGPPGQPDQPGGSQYEGNASFNDGDRAGWDSARHRHVAPWVTGIFLAVLLLGGVSFFLGQQTVGRFGQRVKVAPGSVAVTAAAEGTGASDAALKTADAVIEAIGKGDLPKAAALLAQAQSEGIDLPGQRYQAALLALAIGGRGTADQSIERSIAARDSVPECLYLRANLDATGGNYGLAAADFADATRYTPFSPRNFFFRAECLRRNGNPAQAISQFEQALRCRPGPEDADLIYFKLRLATLETGTDTAYQAQLAAKLTQEPVAGDTLLLGAADEINKGSQSAALEFVRKAAAVLPAGTFRSRLRDFAFRSLPSGGQLAPASLTPRPAAPVGRVRALIDPATQSLQQADPANW
jgi:tetratricopeptide (TPR) repeat protein